MSAALALLLAGLGACGGGTDNQPARGTTAGASAAATSPGAHQSTKLEQLSTNRLKWNDAGITDYRFRVTILTTFNTFGRDPVVMTVHGDTVSMTHSDGTPYQRTDNGYDVFWSYSSIDRTFDALSQDLTTAYKTTATYDPTYGYPTSLATDADFNKTDDETSIVISQFEVLD